MEFAMKKIMLFGLQEEYADASGHLPCKSPGICTAGKPNPGWAMGHGSGPRGNYWERALNGQASPGDGELCHAGQWQRGNAASPISPPQTTSLPLATLIFSKAPWPQQRLLAPCTYPWADIPARRAAAALTDPWLLPGTLTLSPDFCHFAVIGLHGDKPGLR